MAGQFLSDAERSEAISQINRQIALATADLRLLEAVESPSERIVGEIETLRRQIARREARLAEITL